MSEDFSVTKPLFSTKRLIVDVIRFQPGETLTEILDSTATQEQVSRDDFLREAETWTETVGNVGA